MSAPQINALMDLWAATLLEHGAGPPFDSCRSLYNTIDSIPLAGAGGTIVVMLVVGRAVKLSLPGW